MAHTTYKKELVQDSFDAIVVGSGIGGLAAAAFLAKEGKRVLVLERHYVAGGFTHTFARKGYEWDVGLHYIGEVQRKNSVLRRVFDYITDGELAWSFMTPVYDRVVIGEDSYDLVAGTENFKKQLKDYFPSEAQAIDGYIEHVMAAAAGAQSFFAQRALPPLIGRVAAPFMTRKFLSYSDRTTLEVLQSLTSNPRLIGVLAAQYGDYGLPPSQSSFAIHALVVKHYLDGGNYPIGGSGRIADTILPVIEKNGGRVLVKADVQQVIIKNGRAIGVRLSNGDEILAPVVISDAGAINTFSHLVPHAEATRLGLLQLLQKVQPSVAHVCLYIGIKECTRTLGIPQTNYWIYPHHDHDENVRRYLENPEAPLPVTYLSFPSAKDPDFENRYPGRTTIEAIGLAPYEWFSRWEGSKWMKRGADYDALKEVFVQRLFEQLFRFFPHLKGKIDHYELSTPLTTRHFCSYDKGEIYGLDHTPERFRQRWLRPHTPIKGLYLTGQDIVSDGIGGALFGGVLTASALTGKNLIKDVFKAKQH
jgi:all-trans-retinol 13,14-reductase